MRMASGGVVPEQGTGQSAAWDGVNDQDRSGPFNPYRVFESLFRRVWQWPALGAYHPAQAGQCAMVSPPGLEAGVNVGFLVRRITHFVSASVRPLVWRTRS